MCAVNEGADVTLQHVHFWWDGLGWKCRAEVSHELLDVFLYKKKKKNTNLIQSVLNCHSRIFFKD